MKAVILPRLTELRMVVRSKLSDPSVLVRRAAFRAAGVWLQECEDQTQMHFEAGEMLRRLRNETAQIKSQALTALERVVFSKGKGCKASKQKMQETIVQRLCILHAHNGVGGAGVRDLLSAHCKAIEGNANLPEAAGAATCAMEEIATCTLSSLPEGLAELELHLSLLEQVSLERPAAFHKHLNRFAQWLQKKTDQETPESLVLPIAACNILAQVLPSWTQSASTLSKQKMANSLTERLSCLLDEEAAPAQDLGQLARVVVKCLAVVVEHLVPTARDLLMGHFGRSIRLLSETLQDVERDLSPQASHGKMCRHTWIVGSLLEFLDAKSMEFLGEAVAQVSCKDGALEIVSKAAVSLLSDCCLRGPAAAKPAMIPALGFALRRFPQLLDLEEGRGAPLTVLRYGLAASGGHAASVLRLRATETFAGLAVCYQEAAETNGPTKKKDNSASVAAQKLATLQAELMTVLQADEKTIQQALRGFCSLCDLGVIHPASAVPGIIAVTVAGTKAAARHARRLLLRLVESGPPLLAQRCGAGFRAAAQQLHQAQECVEVYSESWRFAPLCEAYAEFLEGKHQRDQFLCSLVSETLAEADISEGPSMFRLQLTAGLLARLPLSKEAELARIVHAVVQFLTLKVAPYLTLDDQEKADKATFPPPSRATCATAVVLYKLCSHWLDLVGADFAKQMRETWGSALSLSSSDFDQALPIAFSRQNLPDLAGLFQKIHSIGECEGVEALLKEIEVDSPLLNSKACARALAIKSPS